MVPSVPKLLTLSSTEFTLENYTTSSYKQTNKHGTRKKTQGLEHLSLKSEDQRSEPQYPCKSQAVVVAAYNPSIQKAEIRDPQARTVECWVHERLCLPQ